VRWLRRRAENVAAGLLAAMFIAFVIQIVLRYAFNFPVGWAAELTVATWLWLVLFGSAFVLSEKEEIRFDLIYSAAGPRVRHALLVRALELPGDALLGAPNGITRLVVARYAKGEAATLIKAYEATGAVQARVFTATGISCAVSICPRQ